VSTFCKDKAKFGGPNRNKQCCKMRKCLKVCECIVHAVMYVYSVLQVISVDTKPTNTRGPDQVLSEQN